MLSVKLITPKRVKQLGVILGFPTLLLFVSATPVFAQDNSPYSRYGLGDQVPTTNVTNRSMGGIAAGYINPLTINFSNPASYGWFQTFKESKSKKITSGRVVIDVGINMENRTLIEPNNTTLNSRFTASNLLFSHVQVGVPLRSNWGLVFGIRPMNRISYNISRFERLYDPFTGQNIDTAQTLNQGDGGAFLPTIGSGFKFKVGKDDWIGIGANLGYLFGRKEFATRRVLFNDTVSYTAGNWQNSTSYGGLWGDIGVQYNLSLANHKSLVIGATANLQRTLKGSQDILRQTYYYSASVGNVQIDSVSSQKGIKGDIVYPAGFTVGFVLKDPVDMEKKKGGWLLGADFKTSQWSNYRFYNQPDSVTNSWGLHIGGEIYPAPRNNYFSNVIYRFGLFTGKDYVSVKENLPLYGITAGIGLPLFNSNRRSNQFSMINLGFEYIKRGNNDNLLKENMFRISAGLSLTDMWFGKRKYD